MLTAPFFASISPACAALTNSRFVAERQFSLTREPATLSLTFTTCAGVHQRFSVQHSEVACLSTFACAGARVAGDKTRHVSDLSYMLNCTESSIYLRAAGASASSPPS